MLPYEPGGIGARHVVHRDPQLAVVFTTVMHADDVGMPQRRGDIGFTFEPLPVLVIGRDPGAQNLQRVLAGEPGVLGEVDLTHPSGTQAPDNGIPGKVGPSCQWHGRILKRGLSPPAEARVQARSEPLHREEAPEWA